MSHVAGCRQSKGVSVGRVLVLSAPSSGADIFINDREQTFKTNAFFDLKPGVYVIKLLKHDPTDPDEPLVGEARVQVKAGKVQRLTIALNKMKIVPAATAGPVRPESQGQKAVLDYYAALNAKDWQKAYAYLSRRFKWGQGGFYRFSKTAARTASVKVVGVRLESADPTKAVEIDRVTLETVKAPARHESTPSPERIEVLITTIDDLGGVGLPKIDAIVGTTAASSQ